MDDQNHGDLTCTLKDPVSSFNRQMARIKFNAGQVLEEYAKE